MLTTGRLDGRGSRLPKALRKLVLAPAVLLVDGKPVDIAEAAPAGYELIRATNDERETLVLANAGYYLPDAWDT